MFCSGSYASFTPIELAVAGMSCIKPIAPQCDVTLGWKPDSCFITAFTNALSRPFLAEYCSISESISAFPLDVEASSLEKTLSAKGVSFSLFTLFDMLLSRIF